MQGYQICELGIDGQAMTAGPEEEGGGGIARRRCETAGAMVPHARVPQLGRAAQCRCCGAVHAEAHC